MKKNSIVIIIVIVAAVSCGVIGFMLAPKPGADTKAIELQRSIYLKREQKLKAQAESLIAQTIKLEQRRIDDSTRYANQIQVKEIAIAKLNKRINEISLSHASAADLDSIRIRLYGARNH